MKQKTRVIVYIILLASLSFLASRAASLKLPWLTPLLTVELFILVVLCIIFVELPRGGRGKKELPTEAIPGAIKSEPEVRRERSVSPQTLPRAVHWVGRKDELAHLEQFFLNDLPDNWFMVVEGEPGLGKSALLAEAASRDVARHYFGSRIFYYSSPDTATMLPDLARRLGAEVGPADDPADCVIKALPDEPLLIMLDAMEQLRPEASRTLAEFLRKLAPARHKTLRILAAARSISPDADLPHYEPFILHSGLDDAAGAELFRSCAPENAHSLAIKFTQILGGHPKMLELTASLCYSEPPQDVLNRARTLTGDIGQKLTELIAWNFGALNQKTRRLLAYLPVLSGEPVFLGDDACTPEEWAAASNTKPDAPDYIVARNELVRYGGLVHYITTEGLYRWHKTVSDWAAHQHPEQNWQPLTDKEKIESHTRIAQFWQENWEALPPEKTRDPETLEDLRPLLRSFEHWLGTKDWDRASDITYWEFRRERGWKEVLSEVLTRRGFTSLRVEMWGRLLTLTNRDAAPDKWAATQTNLGEAYRQLPTGDRSENLKEAIKYCKAALTVYTRDAAPFYWAMTQNNLGIAYSELPTGDRSENLKKAIKCYEAALTVYTREAAPSDWAMTQNNLGEAYRNLPTGDRSENLKKAIKCYEDALTVRTHDAAPADWAGTQNNLGNAYSELPTGDRAENLKKAIKCYETALTIYTRDAAPADWATTQNNLGTAYADLPTGDHAENLKKAIKCYEDALTVRTRNAAPADWATTQNNLGTAYAELPTGDRTENLKKAIKYYESALEIWTPEDFPYYNKIASENLAIARQKLSALKAN